MKRLFLLLVVLLFAVPSYAQFGWLWGDSDAIVWGTLFKNTDSLQIAYAGEVTIMDSGEVVYSNLIAINEDVRGTGLIAVSWDSSDAAQDSMRLDLRFYYNKEIQDGNAGHFGVWHNIGGYMRTDTLYVFELADSSWWQPSSGHVFKSSHEDVAANDTTSIPKLSYYQN